MHNFLQHGDASPTIYRMLHCICLTITVTSLHHYGHMSNIISELMALCHFAILRIPALNMYGLSFILFWTHLLVIEWKLIYIYMMYFLIFLKLILLVISLKILIVILRMPFSIPLASLSAFKIEFWEWFMLWIWSCGLSI